MEELWKNCPLNNFLDFSSKVHYLSLRQKNMKMILYRVQKTNRCERAREKKLHAMISSNLWLISLHIFFTLGQHVSHPMNGHLAGDAYVTILSSVQSLLIAFLLAFIVSQAKITTLIPHHFIHVWNQSHKPGLYWCIHGIKHEDFIASRWYASTCLYVAPEFWLLTVFGWFQV